MDWRGADTRQDTNATGKSLYFENLKGLLILIVVFGHTLGLVYPYSQPAQFLYAAIYFFHMPLFIMVSGYFSRVEPDIQKLFSNLFVVYLLMQLVYAASDAMLHGASFLHSLTMPNWGLWYLLALLTWRLIWPCLYQVPYILPLSIIAAILCGYFELFSGLLSRLLVFFPFFVLGQMWSVRGGREYAQSVIWASWPLFMVTGVAAYSIFFALDLSPFWLYGKYSFADLGEQHWWSGGLRLLLLAGAAPGICLCLIVVPTKETWLTSFGASTISIYLFHFLILDLLNASGLIQAYAGIWEQQPLFTLLIAGIATFLIAKFLSFTRMRSACEMIYRHMSTKAATNGAAIFISGVIVAAVSAAAARADNFEVGETFKDCTDCPTMVVLPAGTFMMGSPENEKRRSDNEGPQHEVTIPAPFAVGKFEVTFAEWDACVSAGGCDGSGPESEGGDNGWGRGNRPVIEVNWDDSKSYISWLSRKTGKTYRLLSEAEWEYAARAGTTSQYSWGNNIGSNRANCNGCGSQWDNTKTAPVGSFAANAFGLYDMHGNVREWVEDCWNDSYSGAPNNESARLSGECNRCVLRGGSAGLLPRFLRSAVRSWGSSGYRNGISGFRLARTLN